MRIIYRFIFPNGKYYIGQTNNFKQRMYIHKSDMKKKIDTPIEDINKTVEKIRKQDNDMYKFAKPHLKPYADKAKKLQAEKNLNIIWLKRDGNLAGQILEKEVKANARKRNKESKEKRKDEKK